MNDGSHQILVRSSGALGVGSVVEYAARFLRNIILARVLAPEAFGSVALLIACIAVAEALTEVGLREVIVQNRGSRRPEFLNAAWWLALVRGFLLYLALWFVAPWIGELFDQTHAVNLLRCGFLVTVLNAATSPALHVLQKDLSFKAWVWLVQGSGVVGVAVAVVAGLLTHSVWALVAGLLVESLCRCAASFLALPFRPSWSLDRGAMGEILKFSRGIFGLPIMMVILLQADTFVVGRLFAASMLGLYSLSRDLADLPNKVLSRLLGPLLLPVFSAQQEDETRIRQRVVEVISMMLAVGLPYTVFCVLLGRAYLQVVYGAAVAVLYVPFALLSVAILLQIVSLIIMNAFLGMGRPSDQRAAALARTATLLLILYPLAVLMQTAGVALAVLISIAVSLLLQVRMAGRMFGLSPAEVFVAGGTGFLLSGFTLAGWAAAQAIGAGPLGSVLLGLFGCGLSWWYAFIRLPPFRRFHFAWRWRG